MSGISWTPPQGLTFRNSSLKPAACSHQGNSELPTFSLAQRQVGKVLPPPCHSVSPFLTRRRCAAPLPLTPGWSPVALRQYVCLWGPPLEEWSVLESFLKQPGQLGFVICKGDPPGGLSCSWCVPRGWVANSKLTSRSQLAPLVATSEELWFLESRMSQHMVGWRQGKPTFQRCAPHI